MHIFPVHPKFIPTAPIPSGDENVPDSLLACTQSTPASGVRRLRLSMVHVKVLSPHNAGTVSLLKYFGVHVDPQLSRRTVFDGFGRREYSLGQLLWYDHAHYSLTVGAYNELGQPATTTFPMPLTAVPECVEASTTSLTAPPAVYQTAASSASPVSLSFASATAAPTGTYC